MIIELPDDANVTVNVHARSRAHVKDMQAQFPAAEWRHEMIPWSVGKGVFPIVETQIGETTITIFPRKKAANA